MSWDVIIPFLRPIEAAAPRPGDLRHHGERLRPASSSKSTASMQEVPGRRDLTRSPCKWPCAISRGRWATTSARKSRSSMPGCRTARASRRSSRPAPSAEPILAIRKFHEQALHRRGTGAHRNAHAGAAAAAPRRRREPAEHPDLGRHRHRQDHAAECAGRFHPGRRSAIVVIEDTSEIQILSRKPRSPGSAARTAAAAGRHDPGPLEGHSAPAARPDPPGRSARRRGL